MLEMNFLFFFQNAGLADYLVMKVRANDADEGENGRITYHFKVNDTDVQETDEFFIHPDTGDLRTKIILDREVKSKYEVPKHKILNSTPLEELDT